MATPPKGLGQANKVVVAFLDGRRLKGYTFDFSTMKEFFNLLPALNTLQEQGTKILIKDLKAVFFVKDFQGNREYQEKVQVDERAHGRKIEVTFRDGEVVLGKTEGYNPQKPGFFMFPGDAESNNTRIFVVTRNVKKVNFA